MSEAADIRWMAEALRLAAQGMNTTRPNPRVGCVLVKAGVCVGRGWHQRAGEPHAEVHALRQAGKQAQGATAYVTLEPCSHQGKTPPCANALIEAGVTRVVAAMQDPNPLVAGRGLQALQAAGITVQSGLCETQARELNVGFVQRMERGLPFVRVKMGMSLDGGTALKNGVSQWITSPQSRADVQRFRARSCAILTGIGTVLADDPSLTVRLPPAHIEGPVPEPLRVVLDSAWRLPLSAKMLRLPGKVIVYGSESAQPQRRAALQQSGLETQTIAQRDSGLDLSAVLRDLAARGINEVLVEAGATLAGALVQEGLVNELVLYQAPRLLGDSARGAFALGELTELNQAGPMRVVDLRQIGPDSRITMALTLAQDAEIQSPVNHK